MEPRFLRFRLKDYSNIGAFYDKQVILPVSPQYLKINIYVRNIIRYNMKI